MNSDSHKDWGKIAVLVIDIQNDFCDDNGIFSRQGLDVKPAQKAAQRIKRFIDEIRRYDTPIIYSRQIEAEDISPANLKRQFAGWINGVCAPGSWGSGFYRIRPTESEYILEKRTYDVFSNPELKRILDEHEIKTLVIAGVNTDICIDTTVRRAFTEGYQIVVPKDLVATMNKAGEKYYLTAFDRFFGEVVHSKTVLSYLSEHQARSSKARSRWARSLMKS